MNTEQIQNYLYKHIPVTKALGIKAIAFSKEEIKFSAPLSNNINHRSTAFGGSISSLLITTGWSYLRLFFDDYASIPQIVISKSATNFLEPITSDFSAELVIPDSETLTRLLEMFKRFGKARIILQAHIKKGEHILAAFEGEFAVLK